jgi:hypothetical protein
MNTICTEITDMFIFSGNTFTFRWTNEAFADLSQDHYRTERWQIL